MAPRPPVGRGKGKGGDGKPKKKKGPTVGSGGVRRRALEGRGPTPKATDRPSHPAARKAAAAARRTATRPAPRGSGNAPDDVVVGRNPVVEALRAGVPATTLLVAAGLEPDERVTEAIRRATLARANIREATKSELDRMSGGAVHQGLALVAKPFTYVHPDDLLADAPDPALLVALDGVTDPRNVGAIVRSVAAFGGHGVLLPERRAAGITPSAWKTSAGAVARVPVARATNLARTLKAYKQAGVFVAGLAADAALQVDDLVAATEPLCLVVGAEDEGLGRLVREACDLLVAIPIERSTESLNASVAAGVALASISRLRTQGGSGSLS